MGPSNHARIDQDPRCQVSTTECEIWTSDVPHPRVLLVRGQSNLERMNSLHVRESSDW